MVVFNVQKNALPQVKIIQHKSKLEAAVYSNVFSYLYVLFVGINIFAYVWMTYTDWKEKRL